MVWGKIKKKKKKKWWMLFSYSYDKCCKETVLKLQMYWFDSLSETKNSEQCLKQCKKYKINTGTCLESNFQLVPESARVKYEGHPTNRETLLIIPVFIKFSYRKYNLSMAYLVAHTKKDPKLLSDRRLLVASKRKKAMECFRPRFWNLLPW